MFKFYSRANDSVINPQGYFCSELVAAIFKLFEILPKEISSAQYWPGAFSSKGKLDLCNGASLGDEFLIEFM